jgi:hypothetical protein
MPGDRCTCGDQRQLTEGSGRTWSYGR